MAYVLDLHTHSHHSDGRLMPKDLVASAQHNNMAVTHMALTDHGTFGGCSEFIDACHVRGIEGFAAAEIYGSHREHPDIEFHFLTFLGNRWDDCIAARAERFIPYLNRQSLIETQNIFLFLEAATKLDVRIPYSEVVRKAVEFYHDIEQPKSTVLIGPVSFAHLRMVLRDRKLEVMTPSGPSDFQRKVWTASGVGPLPPLQIDEAYPIYEQTRPATVLAHPMTYGLTVEQIRPLCEEWKRTLGLVAIEAHYRGVLCPQWKQLADDLDLHISVGTDMHNSYTGAEPRFTVPVLAESEANIPALLTALRAAGER